MKKYFVLLTIVIFFSNKLDSASTTESCSSSSSTSTIGWSSQSLPSISMLRNYNNSQQETSTEDGEKNDRLEKKREESKKESKHDHYEPSMGEKRVLHNNDNGEREFNISFLSRCTLKEFRSHVNKLDERTFFLLAEKLNKELLSPLSRSKEIILAQKGGKLSRERLRQKSRYCQSPRKITTSDPSKIEEIISTGITSKVQEHIAILMAIIQRQNAELEQLRQSQPPASSSSSSFSLSSSASLSSSSSSSRSSSSTLSLSSSS